MPMDGSCRTFDQRLDDVVSTFQSIAPSRRREEQLIVAGGISQSDSINGNVSICWKSALWMSLRSSVVHCFKRSGERMISCSLECIRIVQPPNMEPCVGMSRSLGYVLVSSMVLALLTLLSCSSDETLPRAELLTRVSLDLRGVRPSIEELDAAMDEIGLWKALLMASRWPIFRV